MVETTLKLPEDGEIYGAWLTSQDDSGKFDLHVLANEGGAVVIGKNTPELYDGTLQPAFANPALVIQKDKCWVQYKGRDGKLKQKDLAPEVVQKALHDMLKKLKGSRKRRVKSEPESVNV